MRVMNIMYFTLIILSIYILYNIVYNNRYNRRNVEYFSVGAQNCNNYNTNASKSECPRCADVTLPSDSDTCLEAGDCIYTPASTDVPHGSCEASTKSEGDEGCVLHNNYCYNKDACRLKTNESCQGHGLRCHLNSSSNICEAICKDELDDNPC